MCSFVPLILLSVGIKAELKVSPETDCWNEKGNLSAIIKMFEIIPEPKKAAIKTSLIKPEIWDNKTNIELINEFFVKFILLIDTEILITFYKSFI